MKNYIICLMTMMTATVTVTGQTPTQSQPSGITTEQFINQAALSGMKEVAAGKMAMQKAQRAQLKDYGAMMTQDHDKANAELTAIAKSKGITLPSSADTTAVSSGSGSIGTRPATDGTQTGLNSTAGTTVNANTTGSTTGSSRVTTGITETDKSIRTVHTSNKAATKTKNVQPSPGSAANSMNDGNDSLKMVNEADVTAALKQLYALESTQFDDAYTEMMVADHKNAATYSRSSKSLKLIRAGSSANQILRGLAVIKPGAGNKNQGVTSLDMTRMLQRQRMEYLFRTEIKQPGLVKILPQAVLFNH